MLTAYVDTSLRDRAFTSTLAAALTVESFPMYAWTLVLAMPMSTPPATPTNPPPMPPATVSDLKVSTAVTFTDCLLLVVPSWLTKTLSAMNAIVATVRRVTPTPPATPTKPPPAAAASPNTSSFDVAWTATTPPGARCAGRARRRRSAGSRSRS